MARTPQRTLNQDLIVTNGDAITGDDATGGAGGTLELEGGNAAAASSAAAGSVILHPGVPDGAGAKGIVNIRNNSGDNDTTPVLQVTSQGTNAEDIRFFVGTQDPNGTISANPGDIYVRHSGTSSTVKVNSGAADANTTWTDLAAGDPLTGIPGNIYENLVFYVDPSDRHTYPSTGTTVTDIMGNGTSGTLAGSTFDNGNFQFNGTSGSLTFTKGSTLDNIFSGGGTVLVFYRPNSDGEGSDSRIADTTDGLDEGWFFSTVGDVAGRQSFRFQRNFSTSAGGTWTTSAVTDPISGSSAIPIILGPWQCMAVVYDDGATTNDPVFYLNGRSTAITENTAPTGAAVSDAGNSLVFANRTADDRTFDGDLGPILMFDRSLTANEVRAVFNIFGRRFGLGLTGIGSTTLSAQSAYIVGGESTGTADANGGDILIQGGSQDASSGSARAGDVVIRGGAFTGTHGAPGRPGNILIESGAKSSVGGSATSDITIRCGTASTTGSTAGALTLNAGDTTVAALPGSTTIRGGSTTSTSTAGGSMTVQGGTGVPGGTLFLRSGGTSSATSSTSGNITISTDRNATGGTDTDTGDITISTTGNGATAGDTGNISITCGSTAAVTGNNPGDITVTAGSFTVANNFATAGGVTIAAGSGTATTSGGGGSVSITAGNNTNTGTMAATGVAGGVTLTAGNMAGTGASAVGGTVALVGGAGTGTVTTGGPITLTAGVGTTTAAGGAITLTCGATGTGTGGAGSFLAGAGGTTGAGGGMTVAGGAGGSTSGAGGATTVRGGNATAGASNGGAVTVNGGTATTTGTGGTATLNGGQTGTTGNGGSVSIFGAGGGSTSGNGGAVTINGGDVNSGTAGAIDITAGDSAGSSAGAAVTVSGGSSSTGTPGAVNLRTTANTASVNVRTQSTFTSTVHEHFTNGQQTSLASGGSQTNLVTLGSLATNGRNMKLEVYVTGVDNAAGSNHNSQRTIQTYYRTSAGVVTAMTAHLTNSQNSGGAGNFAADVTYNLFISGNDIILRALNASSTTTFTANITIWWNRQEGGFAS
jgi:hypothetical protein